MFRKLYIVEYKFKNMDDVNSILYFQNSAFDIIVSWSGRAGILAGGWGSPKMDPWTSLRKLLCFKIGSLISLM